MLTSPAYKHVMPDWRRTEATDCGAGVEETKGGEPYAKCEQGAGVRQREYHTRFLMLISKC